MSVKSKYSILIIRPPDLFSEILRRQGHDVVNLPLIRTERLVLSEEIAAKLEQLNDYDGIFFTSPAAAEFFLSETENLNVKFQGKIYVLGNRCRSMFEERGIDVIWRDSNTIEQYLDQFDEDEFTGRKFLYFRGSLSADVIRNRLRDRSVIDEIIVYKTVAADPDTGTATMISTGLIENTFDWICFFSPSAVDRFTEIFGIEKALSLKAAAIGETTAAAIRKAGFDLKMTAQKATSQDFATELLEYLV